MTSQNLPTDMMAIVTTGNGGYDKLEYRKVPVPQISKGEVLLRVLAAGMNNTEINTRLGWYSQSVTDPTDALGIEQSENQSHKADGGWNEATLFPSFKALIVAARLSASQMMIITIFWESVFWCVLVCAQMGLITRKQRGWHLILMARLPNMSKCQPVKYSPLIVSGQMLNWQPSLVPMQRLRQCFTAPTASKVTVFAMGASGGVGSAVVQLAKLRGAIVTAVTTTNKADRVRAIGADNILDRNADLIAQAGEEAFDLIVDNVAGPSFGDMLKLLVRGGRYTSSGAIAGPVVPLDMRDMYLKDITLIGTTAWMSLSSQILSLTLNKQGYARFLPKHFP